MLFSCRNYQTTGGGDKVVTSSAERRRTATIAGAI
jgi:hypothetical protein